MPNGDTINLIKQVNITSQYKIRIAQRIARKNLSIDTLVIYYKNGNIESWESWNESNDLYHPVMDSVFDIKTYLMQQILKGKIQ